MNYSRTRLLLCFSPQGWSFPGLPFPCFWVVQAPWIKNLFPRIIREQTAVAVLLHSHLYSWIFNASFWLFPPKLCLICVCGYQTGPALLGGDLTWALLQQVWSRCGRWGGAPGQGCVIPEVPQLRVTKIRNSISQGIIKIDSKILSAAHEESTTPKSDHLHIFILLIFSKSSHSYPQAQ